MKRYETYKDSGAEWIVEIPEQWHSIKLKFLGYLFSGLSGKKGDDFKKDDSEFNKNYIPFTNIANNSVIDPCRLDSVEIFENENQNAVKKNDIFFLMSSENYDDIGKTAVLLLELENTYLNSFCKGFRLNNQDDIDAVFLNYLLSGDIYRKLLSTEAKGFTRINLQMGKIQNLPVSLPKTKKEQTQIATYLDHKTGLIDAIIAQKEDLIKKLKEQRQAIINEAVTKGLNKDVKLKDSGIEWLGEIPEHWEVCKIKHLVELKSGNFISANEIEPQGKYPVYGGNGLRGFTNKHTHYGSYILIGRQGALCGNINYAHNQFWATEHAVVTTFKTIMNLDYFGELLRSMNLNQYNESAAQPGLAVGKIENLNIPKISIDEQEKIASFIKLRINLTKTLICKNMKQIEKLKEYRQSLISEAVTGKIDVRDWQAPKS